MLRLPQAAFCQNHLGASIRSGLRRSLNGVGTGPLRRTHQCLADNLRFCDAGCSSLSSNLVNLAPRRLSATSKFLEAQGCVGNASFSSESENLDSRAPDVSCIGMIGLGNMGLPTALNLVSAGYKVVAYDLNEQAVNEVVVSGGIGAKNVKELAEQATLVLSMLPTIDQLKQVYTGKDGVFENLPKKDTYIVEASTIGPVASAEIVQEAEKHGHRMIDAPVSGGIAAATAGTLTFMVGAPEVHFRAIEPFLRRLGRTVVHCGDVTKGQAVKVCNNVILASTMMGVSEGYRLAQCLGVDMKLFNKVVNSSSGRCWSSEVYNPVPGLAPNVPAAREYRGGFNTRLMAKDLGIALEASEIAGTTLPVTKIVSGMYKDLQEQGYGDLDFSCVFLHNK